MVYMKAAPHKGEMKIDVRFRGLEGSDALRRYVVRRVGFALDRFSNLVQEVVIRLSDVNGPRGGADKRCQVTVHGRAMGAAIAIEAEGADAYAVTDEAIMRAARTAVRRRVRVRRTRVAS